MGFQISNVQKYIAFEKAIKENNYTSIIQLAKEIGIAQRTGYTWLAEIRKKAQDVRKLR